MKKDRIDLKEFVLTRTLSVFRVGSDPTNYQILLNSPTTVERISKTFDLTKMPTNRRINQLKEAGLVKREFRTGKVELTPLAKKFIKIIRNINSHVEEQLPKYLAEAADI